MGVSENTFAAFLKTTPARDTWDLGREAGKVSLRRLQLSAAEKSPAMMVWLGKQHLEQRDKVKQAVVRGQGDQQG